MANGKTARAPQIAQARAERAGGKVRGVRRQRRQPWSVLQYAKELAAEQRNREANYQLGLDAILGVIRSPMGATTSPARTQAVENYGEI